MTKSITQGAVARFFSSPDTGRPRAAGWAAVGRWGFAAFLFVLLAAPTVPIIYQAFIDRPLYDTGQQWTLGNFTRLLADPSFLSALGNTAWFVLFSTVISTFIGLGAGLLIDRIALPARGLLKVCFLFPLFVSPLILAFAWSMLYGPGGYATLLFRTLFGIGLPNLNSIGGMSLVAGVAQAPISYLYFAGAIGSIPSALENSARSAGASPFRAMLDIVLPLLRPSVLFCVLLNVIMAVDLLAVPLIIGEPSRIQVLASYLYTNGVLSPKVDYGIVAATAVFLLVFIQIIILLQSRVLGDIRRFNTVGGRAARSARAVMTRGSWVLWAILVLYSLIASVIPCAFLILRSFTTFLSPLIPIEKVWTLDNFALIFSYESYVRSIVNTFLIATVGGFIAVVLTCAATIVAYRTTPTMRLVIEQISFLPRAVPGLIVGIGIFYAVIAVPGGSAISHTLLILIIAFTIRYFPTGFAAISPAFLQIGADLERAARVSGGSWFTALRDVTIPLLRPALIACFLIYFVYFFKEYASASFLFGPGTEVIGTTMLQLNLMGNMGSVAALAVVQIALTVPVAIFVYARD
ncbi:MAG: binding-protein-dependent transport system inner rane component [Devosia sp.]|uniref:ABC transporter permease n=1 Tax=Devosia sp. TaxID=1871048 RepID=UPI0026127610|nr:iron ABC transporter permease [Devosia sp.]MDB5527356.1 binding-protein-dependent transport system inner rane component [Devosia sp.]